MGPSGENHRFKGLQNKLPKGELLEKRPRKPPQNSLAAFDAKQLVPNLPKRGTRSRKVILLFNARTITSLAKV